MYTADKDVIRSMRIRPYAPKLFRFNNKKPATSILELNKTVREARKHK